MIRINDAVSNVRENLTSGLVMAIEDKLKDILHVKQT